MINICLLIHCIHQKNSPEPQVHRELFIPLSDIEDLIIHLEGEGYCFKLPGDIGQSDGPVCSLTFDDGYFNIHIFLEVAEKYGIPFILFLTSYNVINQLPFIWDIWEATNKQRWSISSYNYQKYYEKLNENEKSLLKNKNYRPFTQEELNVFATHPLVHLAPHGHTHQPLVGKYQKYMDKEINNNLSFLEKYGCTQKHDFSFPCGLYTSTVKNRLLKHFKRIYTIDGGGYLPEDRVIHRISLINPDFGGPLRDQIKKSFDIKSKIIRKARNIRYSNILFYRI